jgi:hypothetical protein
MKRALLFLFLFTSRCSFAQVINIESKRFLNDTNGFVGSALANFSINQTTKQVIALGVNVHAQYQYNRHRILAITDLSFIKAGDQDFVNSGYQHVRYNYKIVNRVTWEAFVQGQYNRVLLLDRRYLVGTGPRFKVVKKKNFRVYTACLYMYEYQVQNFDSITKYNNRLSTYVTVSFALSKILDFTSTTFYQPNLADFADYRIANDSALEFNLSQKLNFRVGFNMLYDTRQPRGIPAMTYMLKNGIGYKF